MSPYSAASNPSVPERIRWTIEEADCSKSGFATPDLHETVRQIIGEKSLATHFQPIYSAADGSVYGYEALTRVESARQIGIQELFALADETGQVIALDAACREVALRTAGSLGVHETGALLFVNIRPETLMQGAEKIDATDLIVERSGLPKERIVLELTEEYAVKDYDTFCAVTGFYRERGYRIAIDDFGAGYGGLKMLSMIEPDYVKIDRHFVSNVDRTLVRYNLVELVATACHRLGIKVIAEGIERREDLVTLTGLGVEFLQGYLLARPSPELQKGKAPLTVLAATATASATAEGKAASDVVSVSCVGEIAVYVEPEQADAGLKKILRRFTNDKYLTGLPVVEGARVLGMLHRTDFLEQKLLGRLGFAEALNSQKNAGQLVADSQSLCVEYSQRLEEVARLTQARDKSSFYQDVLVTRFGKYYGTITVSDLLKAITERSLMLARAANPLTGLPGNLYIRGRVEQYIAENRHFEVAYIDMDHFKPYNDAFGFERGDGVLKAFAEIIEAAVKERGQSEDFVGHIGGDDFIVVAGAQTMSEVVQEIINRFNARLPEFHNPKDIERGGYVSTDRGGEERLFDLLSLSIGIVSSEVNRLTSIGQLASLASEVKRAAKQQKGTSVVRDRRLSRAMEMSNSTG